jgi:hypothetical protein
MKRAIPGLCLLAMLAQIQPSRAASVAVTTWHNDNSRDGVNSSETILNTSNVSSTTFGKLYSLPVDGQIYAQPLYVPSVLIAGGNFPGTHNVLYVPTMHNTVYAFDADSSIPEILWSHNLGTSVPCTQLAVNCAGVNLQPEIGILSTPVIDVANNSIFVVAQTSVSLTQTQFSLHSLNLTTGAENPHSPVVISGQVAGTTTFGGNGSVLPFDPNWHWQRTGLTLLRGNIYFGFGSIGDVGPWHGWIFGYNETTLNQVVIKCTSPDFYGNAVWQGGAAFAADNASNLYITTGNGSFNASTGGTEWGEGLLKLNTVTNTFTSYFVPSINNFLDLQDLDVSSAGALILPAASPLVAPMIVSGSKYGTVYVLNTANLKGYNQTDQVVQEFQSLTAPNWTNAASLHFGGNVFYNGALYTWGSGDVLKRWPFNGSSFATTLTAPNLGSYQEYAAYVSAPSLSISANGTAAGTGILWASTAPYYSGVPGDEGVLRAYNAANLSTELWDSTMRGSLDDAGSWSKWTPPTIANGKVYVATLDGAVNVYGLLPH